MRTPLAKMMVGLVVLSVGLASCDSAIPFLGKKPAPTPQCVEPKLIMGDTTWRIQSLPLAADGSVSIPPGNPGIAYWIDGTNVHYVFGLEPAGDNLLLAQRIRTGQAINITWADCTNETFAITSVEQEVPATSTLLDQTTGGFSIFVPAGNGSTGILISGQRPEALITASPEPTGGNDILVDIEFLDSTVSPDGKTFTLGMKLTNRGSQPLTLTSQDIAILPESGGPILPTSVEPPLPQDIAAGGEATVQVTFPKPDSPSVVLKIFDSTLEYYLQ